MDEGMQIDVIPDCRRRIRAGQVGTARLNGLKSVCQPFLAVPYATAFFCVVIATAGGRSDRQVIFFDTAKFYFEINCLSNS
jgi:hypothetical protein